jgi:transposase
MVEGTTAESIINVITKITQKERAKVSEITLDMSGSVNLVARKCLPG